MGKRVVERIRDEEDMEKERWELERTMVRKIVVGPKRIGMKLERVEGCGDGDRTGVNTNADVKGRGMPGYEDSYLS
jgi:hypothetical protein